MKDVVDEGYPSADRASLLPRIEFSALELGSAFELEMIGREFLHILRRIRNQFEATQRRRGEFDRLCDGVEEWLREEMDQIRFLRTDRDGTALDS